MTGSGAATTARPAWRVRHAAGGFLAGIAASVVAAVVLVGVTGREPTDLELFAVIFAAQSVGSIGAVAWLARRHGTGSLARDLGLQFRRSDLWGILIGFGLQIGLALLLLPLLDLFGIDGPAQEVSEITSGAEGATVVAAFVSLVVLAPIAEELLFRGLLLRALLARWAPLAAVAGSAAVFAAVHLLDPGAAVAVPVLFVAGAVMGETARRRGDLGMAIVIHAVFNFTAFLGLVYSDELGIE